MKLGQAECGSSEGRSDENSRARYTLRGLMVVVALAAVVFALTTWR